MTKYASNAYSALKVIYANQIFDLATALRIDYHDVVGALEAIPFVGNTQGMDVFRDGFRGYSGACLPKDLKALIDFGRHLGVDLGQLEATDALNEKLLNDWRNRY